MRSLSRPALLLAAMLLILPSCEKTEETHHVEHAHKVVVTSPVSKDVVITQQYVSQIHSSRHIEIQALESGYLDEISVKEGQAVKQGDTLFNVLPVLYQAKLDSEAAEVNLAQIELRNAENLLKQNVYSQPKVALAQARLAKAEANLKMARAELNFATVKAPFDGIIDRLHNQQGSLIKEGDVLTTLSDNSLMWVYFNVPEARYLEYKAELEKQEAELQVELVLANGEKFPHVGKIGAIEADFNNETGNIAFRADFPNPTGLLRHGQTGTVLISRVIPNATVIPQRATFEILAKKFAFVVSDASSKNALEQGEIPASGHATEDNGVHGHEHAGSDHGAQQTLALVHNVAYSDEHKTEAEHGHNANGEHGVEHHSEIAGEHGVAHQREIEILNEMDDIFLIRSGLDVKEKIILEGVQQVRDGEPVTYEFRDPEDVLNNLKYKAE